MRFRDHQCFDSEGSTVTFVWVLLHTDAILTVVYLSNDLNPWRCMGFLFFAITCESFICCVCFSSGEGALCILQLLLFKRGGGVVYIAVIVIQAGRGCCVYGAVIAVTSQISTMRTGRQRTSF